MIPRGFKSMMIGIMLIATVTALLNSPWWLTALGGAGWAFLTYPSN